MKYYLPLVYSEKVKRPNKKYILNNIFGEDSLLLLLAYIYGSPSLLNAIGLLFLQLSFWCIYELGYIENDIVGDKFEDRAVLSYNYKTFNYTFRLWEPWVWSIFLSIIGTVLLKNNLAIDSNPFSRSLFDNNVSELYLVSIGLVFWLAFLLVLRALFHIYNNLNKQSRVWFYVLLQACRYCGYLVLLTTNQIGLFLLFSIIITRCILYILYRYMGGKSQDWPMEFPRYFFCLLLYSILIISVALNERDPSLILNFQVLLITLFCIARGGKQFYKIKSQFVHVSKDSSNRVT